MSLDVRAGRGVSVLSVGSQRWRLLISASPGSKTWFPESIYKETPRSAEAECSESTFQAERRGSRLSVTLVRFASAHTFILRAQPQLDPTAKSLERAMRTPRPFRPSRTLNARWGKEERHRK